MFSPGVLFSQLSAQPLHGQFTTFEKCISLFSQLSAKPFHGQLISYILLFSQLSATPLHGKLRGHRFSFAFTKRQIYEGSLRFFSRNHLCICCSFQAQVIYNFCCEVVAVSAMTSHPVQQSQGKRSATIAERLCSLMQQQEEGRQAAFLQLTAAHESTTNVMQRMVNMQELKECNPEGYAILRQEERRQDQRQRRHRVKERKKAAAACSTDCAPEMEEGQSVSCERPSCSKSLARDGRPASKAYAKAIKTTSVPTPRSRSPTAYRHRGCKPDKDGDCESECSTHGQIRPDEFGKRREELKRTERRMPQPSGAARPGTQHPSLPRSTGSRLSSWRTAPPKCTVLKSTEATEKEMDKNERRRRRSPSIPCWD